MKAVLISIQPKWVERICNEVGEERGKPIYEKTIEVRKTRPKIDSPFKCFIYCTMGKIQKFIYNEKLEKESIYDRYPDIQNGKVIGEFVCDRIVSLAQTEHGGYYVPEEGFGYACMTVAEVRKYGNGKPLYGWHISDLKIYDKPKELSEFFPIKPKRVEKWSDKDDCAFCKYHRWGKHFAETCLLNKPEPICEYTPPLERPPQSWCYVEVQE